MVNNEKRVFDGLLEDYVGLDESAGVLIRMLKKMRNAQARGKLVAELRSLEKMRRELLDEMDQLAKIS